MKKDCNIVRDLLPLYFEKISSEESNEFVEKHLTNCESCNEYANRIKDNLFQKTKEIKDENSYVLSLKKLKIRLLKKNIIVSVISAIVAVSLILLIQLIQIPIEYDENLFAIMEAEDGVIDIVFEDSDYYCAHGVEREVVKDNKTINIQYIYFTDSIWTKFFTNDKPKDALQFSVGQSIATDYSGKGDTTRLEGQVDYIYYLVEDYKKTDLTDEEFLQLAENGILLWSRE